ncbi:hypothetical protein [Arthrobacter sp. Y-9]|uniref:hypothetical protein n=1 Tax=Arthrobacter sp. Y-9 TaxID=3039385 RepID=UPI00241CFC19|nr:hypothetical protein [Arthrobacter sp. Y-9]WFR83470.1 hypothetical protein P9849_13030 [Arthrobacter sp. Y-9]
MRIAATALVLAPTIDTATAVQQGIVTQEVARDVGVNRLPAAQEPGPPLLALKAAATAISSAHVDNDGIGLIAHAWIHHQGHDFWSPAHYLADQLGAHAALPIGVQTMCNGGETALEIALARMAVDPACRAALVSTSDIFDGDFDRWNSDSTLWYGDAGAAVVLTKSADDRLPEILSTATSVVLSGEGLHRGVDPFTWKPGEARDTIDVRRTKKAHLHTPGRAESFAADMVDALRSVITRSLADAGIPVESDRLRFIALPRVGRKVVGDIYAPAIRKLTPKPLVYLGDDSGHLGAGDTLANLHDMLSHGVHAIDDIGLFICAGAGFTVSCVAVRLGDLRSSGRSVAEDERTAVSA